MGHATLGGVYQQTFDWPANGVIFTEGNARVRGVVTDAPRSLTVVSMNNIYIEGSLEAGSADPSAPHKVLLLARRNVVLNPTQVISRIENQTRLRATPNAGDTQLQVFDANSFHRGDTLHFNDADNTPDMHVVEDPIQDSGIIKTTAVVTGVPLLPGTTVVRTKGDALDSSGPKVFADHNELERFSNVIQRRFTAPAAPDAFTPPDPLRVALRHSANYLPAINIAVVNGTTGTNPTNAYLTNKRVANAQTAIITPADKLLRVVHGTGGTDPDEFPAPGPSTNADAVNYKLRKDVAGPIPGLNLQDNVNSRRSDPNWKYNLTFTVPPSTSAPTGYGFKTASKPLPPFYFLASVGNRKPSTNTSTTFPWQQDLMTAAGTPKIGTVPMATSVVLTINGVPTVICNDSGEEVNQFGFSPIHGVSSTSTPSEAWEDVLTTDQVFYTSSSAASSYILDSRVLASSGLSAGVMNSLELRLNPLVESYFDFTSPTSSAPNIPYYRLARIKLEKVGLNASNQLQSVQPAQALDVHAFVYAQEGSWIVIPGDYYDDGVRNGPNTPTGYTFSSDLNRDGAISRAERVAAFRYRRYNYSISFTGAISENKTASVQATGSVRGEVADWMDKWANVYIDDTNFNSNGTLNGTLLFRTDPATNDFPNITYKYDDDVVKGRLDNDVGFQMPVAPDMMYGA